MQDLAMELQEAVELAVHGEPLGSHLSARIQTAARTVLHRRGVNGAQITVQRRGSTFEVAVLVPPAAAGRVQRLVLQVGVGTRR